MALDPAVRSNLMQKAADAYAKARSFDEWRPPQAGLYTTLFVGLNESTFQAKKDNQAVMRLAPQFQIIDGPFSGKTFSAFVMLTSAESSMADFHRLVESIYGRSISPASIDQDYNLLNEMAGKKAVIIQVGTRKGKDGKDYSDDSVTEVKDATTAPSA